MKILIVDDEPIILQSITQTMKSVIPEGEIVSFSQWEKAVSFARNTHLDAAFLDIELGASNGIVVSKQLKDIHPDVPIIFITCYSEYALDAFSVHATGYLLKPVTKEDIRRVITFIYSRYIKRKAIRIQTFGGFSVFVNNQSLKFGRSKAKELLALLVDRRGVNVTTREACAVLWEDAPYNPAQKNYFHQVLRDLRNTLNNAGAEDILIRGRNSLAIIPERLDCDSYRFMDGDPKAIHSYRHDYMICYSWAEFTLGFLDQTLDKYFP